MRLSWFSGSHGRRPKGRRHKNLKAPALLVRQLERRRVLDAALTSLATTAVVADVNPAPVTVAPNSTNVPPPTNVANNTAQSAAIGSGAILNIPPVLVVATAQNVDEGQQLNLSAQGGAPPLGLYIDPDLGDSHTATVNWGDGSPVQNATVISGLGAGAIGGTHTYADDGTYTVSVSVSDGSGATDTKSFNVMVANVPPVLVTATDQTVNEGQTLDLSGQGGAPPIGLFVDPGALDTHTATIDWGDGSPVQNATVFEVNGSGALGGTHTYADDGVYTVKVTVTDDDGGSDSDTFKVTVNNVAPFVDLSGPTMVNEGSSNSWSLGPVVDPGTDTVSQYIVHWGDGNTDTFTAAQIAAMSNSISHTYADGPNNYTISLDLVDEDGTHSAVDTLGVTVKDVAPFVDLTGPTMVNEGAAGSWSLGPVVDPGTDTVTQYIVHWGDGSTDTFTSAQIAGMGNAVGHTYADGPNNYTISLDLVDEDGTHTAVDTLDVTVKDVAPFVDLTGPTMVNEGAANTWNLGPVVDPGTDTVTQYVIHWGDGNTDTFTAAQIAAMSNNVGHTYADGPNNYTISVDLVNEDGTHLAVDTLDVAVKNVPPVVDLTGPTMVDEGAPNTWMLGAVVDPGTDTVSQYVIHWGDGNTDTFTSAQIAAMSNNVGHTYADGPNNYTISVDLVDEDGTFAAVDTLDVTVKNVAPFVDLTGPTMVNEGAANTWNLGPVVDPGSDTVTQYIVHWGDGNTDTFTSAQIAAMSNNVGHTYADGPNNYTITLDLVDEDGTFTAVDTLDVAVKNVAPFVDLTGPTMVNEGTASSWTLGPVVDPGTDTVTQYVIHWGDGVTDTFTAAQIAGMANTIGHTYAEGPNNYTISVDLTDEDGTYLAVDTLDVTVKNVAPTVALDTVPNILENGTATLTGTFSDLGIQDPHTVTVTWDDANNAAASTFSVAAIENAGGMTTLHVGDTFNSSTDGAVLTITSVTAATGTVAFSVQHQYLDDGSAALGNGTASDTSTIHVAVADDDGGSGAKDTTVDVFNVNPQLMLVGDQTVNEGQLLDLSAGIGSFSDVGTLDLHTAQIDWGDGHIDVGLITEANGSGVIAGSHTYADNGNYLVTVRLADDDMSGDFANGIAGTDFVQAVLHVQVGNVAPTLAAPVVSSNSINEGGAVSFTANFSDPGFDNPLNTLDPSNGGQVAESFTYDINWGDGRDAVTGMSVADLNGSPGVPSTGTFGGNHVYADNGTYTMTVTVHDDDGGTDFKTFTVTVNNVAPVLDAPVVSNNTIDEGGSVSLSANFSDPGFDNPLNPVIGGEVAESFTYDINWGDGRGAVLGASVADTNGMPGTPSTGNITGSHTYADDGVYTVTVTVHDDDGGMDTKTFQVTVNNVAPSLTGIVNLNVNEGQSFTLTGLGVGLQDPGFDNPNNPTTPALGDPLKETFVASTIDWGDGRGAIPVSIDNVAGRVGGSPGVDTTAQFMHSSYTYADDGTYTVTIRVADDNMGAFSDPTKFVTGTAGVDFVDLTFQITVNNVAPTLAVPVTSLTSINEAQSVNFNVTFTDPGFDNPLNPNPAVQPLIADPKTESFRYFIDWGDGRDQVGAVSAASLVDANGAVGVPSSGSFAGVHNYADDGMYTVTLRIADDNMAAFGSTDKFATGTAGVDFVEQTFTVTVHNVVPTIVMPLEGDQVTATGFTKIRLSFNDPGYDNALNPTTPPTGNPLQESFTYLVNWGDGTTDTIQVSNVSGTPQVVSLQTSVLTSARTSGSEGVLTTGSFEVQHQYFGPPDPINPTADIVITVTLQDDNGGTVNQSVKISNPGIQTVNVAIDTTPQVPRLVLGNAQLPPVVLQQTSAAPQSLQSTEARIVPSEVMATSDRYLELVVISPDGTETERFRLSDEALLDVRGLFATLPDGRYKVFLVRTDNNSHRLVMDVFVRRGRVIDPQDASEGTRDRPPSSDGAQPNNGQPNGAQQVPLNANPLLKPVQTNGQPAASNDAQRSNEQLTNGIVQPAGNMAEGEEPVRSRTSTRWAVPLAALGLVASRESWSQRVGAALEKADENAWQRLRRAGRLGRRTPVRRENLGASTNETK